MTKQESHEQHGMKASDNVTFERLPPRHSFWADKKKPFLMGVSMMFILLQLLFLSNVASLYGLEYKTESKVQAFHVLNVNFDTTGTLVQDSLLAAYDELRGPSLPTLDVHTTTQYPDPESVPERGVQRYILGRSVH